jgi:hypothetical protein
MERDAAPTRCQIVDRTNAASLDDPIQTVGWHAVGSGMGRRSGDKSHRSEQGESQHRLSAPPGKDGSPSGSEAAKPPSNLILATHQNVVAL